MCIVISCIVDDATGEDRDAVEDLEDDDDEDEEEEEDDDDDGFSMNDFTYSTVVSNPFAMSATLNFLARNMRIMDGLSTFSSSS